MHFLRLRVRLFKRRCLRDGVLSRRRRRRRHRADADTDAPLRPHEGDDIAEHAAVVRCVLEDAAGDRHVATEAGGAAPRLGEILGRLAADGAEVLDGGQVGRDERELAE